MDALQPSERRFFAGVAFVAGLVNLIAIAAMGLILAPGTPAGGAVEARVAYLAGNRAAVATGWLLWILASLTLLATFVVLRRIGRAITTGTPRASVYDAVLAYVVAVATVGATLDIGADLLMMAVIPSLAGVMQTRPGDPALIALFRTWDEASVNLTGGVANSFYAGAGLIVTWILHEGRAPRSIVWVGAAAWTVAALATVALAFWPPALPASIAASLFLFVAWAWLIAAWCWLPDRSPAVPVRQRPRRRRP